MGFPVFALMSVWLVCVSVLDFTLQDLELRALSQTTTFFTVRGSCSSLLLPVWVSSRSSGSPSSSVFLGAQPGLHCQWSCPLSPRRVPFLVAWWPPSICAHDAALAISWLPLSPLEKIADTRPRGCQVSAYPWSLLGNPLVSSWWPPSYSQDVAVFPGLRAPYLLCRESQCVLTSSLICRRVSMDHSLLVVLFFPCFREKDVSLLSTTVFPVSAPI